MSQNISYVTLGLFSLASAHLVLGSPAGGQTTWYVDWHNCPGPGSGTPADPFCKIQAGIDVAVSGDAVLVADGTYTGDGNRDLDFGGKAITVRSQNGSETCIIDCEGSASDPHRGFNFHSGEPAGSVVDGFTVRNGHTENGGGILCIDDSDPTITDCVIAGNAASDHGGGVYCEFQSSPTLSHCVILGNAAEGWGGGVFIGGGRSAIANCEIAGNFAGVNGGGVASTAGGETTITDCAITGNTAGAFGGGVHVGDYCEGTIINCAIVGNSASEGGGVGCLGHTYATIRNCTIAGNSVAESGGGVWCMWYSWLMMINCTITENSAAADDWGGGGGVSYDYMSYAAMANCTITENMAVYNGGGIHCRDSTLAIINCTSTGNSAGSQGGGVFCDESSPTVTNCILWDDVPQEIVADSGAPLVSYSDVQGGWVGAGNIDEDPLFADPAGGNFRVTAESPCIDTGDPNFVTQPGERDLDGHARVLCGRVDMGAYEFGIGDFDCDRDVDLFDFAAYLNCVTGPAGSWPAPGCEAFIFDWDDDVDFGDFAKFQAVFEGSLSPRVSQYSNSGCLPQVGPCEQPDEFEFTTGPGTLHVRHGNATYNCCPDDIVVSLSVQGRLLKLTETEILTDPCFCVCCYDVYSTVSGLTPGLYTVEYCWFDYESNRSECHVEDIVIP